ncbi:fibrinogen-like 2a [Scleropages formosus]|uniref:Fibrinogen-like 2a n=1 Tax=Scleropages formosus TaxID=113540 RepID=A0A8C9SJK1_SCLFO|nr:fibroleukin [Scleropages formosus]
MRLGFLSVCSVLLPAALLSGSAGLVEQGGGGCLAALRPGGPCLGENGDECPYRVTLPPLTIQLPKQFRMMEKTAQELQSLRATVNQLKRSCLACRPQADRGLQSDSAEGPAPDLGQEGKGGKGMEEEGSEADGDKERQAVDLHEMQVKMKRMSNSLRNARNQISSLQAQLEEMNLLSRENVETMVEKKVQDQCSKQCSRECPVEGSVQFMIAPRDCSDYNALQDRRNGVYRVSPEIRNGTFEVYCDMESYGGGWTVLQQRLNGSVSFNRTWDDYKRGFGDLRSDFWLGNDHIHLLTKAKDMVLRIELEDFNGVREYAKYERFYVANELLRYKLSVSGYSGTAGDALRFNKHYNHDQKFFTTPDKDNDMYPSGNCGAYYSSGWWFDACMSANLNGKYYHKRYKGVRNGIFWGTWHNVSSEYYPNNYRQAFKAVKMMIRPKNYAP